MPTYFWWARLTDYPSGVIYLALFKLFRFLIRSSMALSFGNLIAEVSASSLRKQLSNWHNPVWEGGGRRWEQPFPSYPRKKTTSWIRSLIRTEILSNKWGTNIVNLIKPQSEWVAHCIDYFKANNKGKAVYFMVLLLQMKSVSSRLLGSVAKTTS